MTQLDLSKTRYTTMFPGIGNPETIQLSYTVPAYSYGPSAPYEQTNTFDFPAQNDLLLLDTQVSGGINDVLRENPGSLKLFFNSSGNQVFSLSYQSIVVIAWHISNGQLVFYTRVSSGDTGAFTVNIRYRRFGTPF